MLTFIDLKRSSHFHIMISWDAQYVHELGFLKKYFLYLKINLYLNVIFTFMVMNFLKRVNKNRIQLVENCNNSSNKIYDFLEGSNWKPQWIKVNKINNNE